MSSPAIRTDASVPAARPSDAFRGCSAHSFTTQEDPTAYSVGSGAVRSPCFNSAADHRSPAVTGVADAVTAAALIRYAAFFRTAGWLLAALGVIGLVKSVGGSTPDTYLQALDKFREMLATSADPALNQAFDVLRQALEAAKPVVEDAARTPPWGAFLSLLGRFVPGPTGSVLTLGLGIILHQFGAKITHRRL